MIRIQRFDEKVSKAEKEEVLNDDSIYAGVEFEVESSTPVIGGSEEMSAEDYAEERDDFIDDYLAQLDLDKEVLVIDSYFTFLSRRNRETVKSFLKEKGYMYRPHLDVYIILENELYRRYYDENYNNQVITERPTLEYYIDTANKGPIRFLVDNMTGEVEMLKKDIDENDYVEEEVIEEALERAEQEFENSLGSTDEKSDIVSELENVIGDDIEVYQKYHAGGKSVNWRIEPDTSLATETGFELITPRGGLPLKELLPIIEGVFDYIDENENLYTSKQTGFHVNMSIKGVDLKEEMDPLKLALFMEEGKVYEYFESRKNNQYTLSMLKELQKPRPQILTPKKKKEYQSVVQDMNNRIIPKQKYYGINLSKVEAGQNYIEFRYIGGADYHKKYDIIRRQILDYGHFLKLSIDPDYKWKEYMLKLNRLINDIEQEVLVKRIKNDIIAQSTVFSKPIEEVAGFFVDKLKQIDDSSIDISEFEVQLSNYISDWLKNVANNWEAGYITQKDVALYYKQFRDILVENNAHRMWDNLKRIWNERVKYLLEAYQDISKVLI
jgi:hypothetical protein